MVTGWPRSSTEQRFARLEERLRRAEQQMDDDWTRAQRDRTQLSERMEAQTVRQEAADRELRAMAVEIAVGTAGLQISGLVLVGFGGVLTAIPAIFG